MLADVDHFFPHTLKPQVASAGCCRPVNVDGVWNLVLACSDCNRGIDGKSAQVPNIELLKRLATPIYRYLGMRFIASCGL